MVSKEKYYSREQVAERLVEVREKSAKASQATFAAALGIPIGTLQSYEQCRADVSVEFLARLNAKLNINSQWILFGIGLDPFEGGGEIAQLVFSATAAVAKSIQARALVLTPEKQAAIVMAVFKRSREELGRSADSFANEMVELAS
jgi:transcriptional regulator with XRE-family HTH domain